MSLDVVSTLQELVSIPSVNPMGRPCSGDIYLETRVTEYLGRLFDRLGVPWETQETAPGRSNILARLEGEPGPAAGGKVLLLEAHQDTVPVDGMTIPPFSAEIREGRLYGRGACDVKGGLAAMLAAFSRLAKLPPRSRPTVILASTVNEEYGFSGARRLTRSWLNGESKLLQNKPDFAIAAEPTRLRVVVAHKGVVRWRLHAKGRAAHSSRPAQGDSAIYRMGRILRVLQEYAEVAAPQLPVHPLAGGATLSVGLIQGGLSVNTVPERCTIELERRAPPGEEHDEALADVKAYLDAKLDPADRPEHDPPYMISRSLPDDRNGDWAIQVGTVASRHGGGGDPIGAPYGTNAAEFAAAGVPTVVFGPGSIEQAHTADEWIALEQLHKGVASYEELAISLANFQRARSVSE